MKSIKRSSVENPINFNGIEYVLCPTLNIRKSATEKEAIGFLTLKVTISLHKNLRGRTDLHGNPYKPTEFLYVSKLINVKKLVR